MTIDHNYVNQVLQLRDHQQVHSTAYKRHAGPLGALAIADEHYRIVSEMIRLIYVDDLPKTIDEDENVDTVRMTIKRIAEHLSKIKEGTTLDLIEVQRLSGLIEHLIGINYVDRMTRNRVQRLVDDLRGHHVAQAYRLYIYAAEVREMTEVKQKATLLEQRLARYRRCVARLRGVPEAALENTLISANFQIIAPQAGLPPQARIELDTEARTINITVRHSLSSVTASFRTRNAPICRKNSRVPTMSMFGGCNLLP
jgi:hypothetical protein